MRVNFFHFIMLMLAVSAIATSPARGQAPPANAADPFLQLMMSQPAVDISSPVTVMAAFDPPLVRPGEKSVYRVTLTATEASIRLPEEISAPPQLKLRFGVSGQIMQTVGATIKPITTFNYDARGSEAGVFAVPEFVAEVYGKPVIIPAARLEVLADLPEAHERVRQLLVETVVTNIFVGEPLFVRVLLLGTSGNSVEGVSQIQINADGFVVDKNTIRQSFQQMEMNGHRVPAYIYETTVTPVATGTLTLSAQGFTSGMQFSGSVVIGGQVTIPGGPPRYVLLDSEPVKINVRPLPMEGEPPGFAGTVGSFTCDLPQLSTNTVRIGEMVQLKVIIRGPTANRLSAPKAPRVQGWQIFPGAKTGIIGEPGTTNFGAAFSYTLIPVTSEVSATPAIPFSCFDPKRAVYVDLTIRPLPIKVVSDEMTASAEVPAIPADSEVEPGSKLAPGKLAESPGRAGSLVPLQLRGWFPLIQIMPAMAFSGLWFWDRRRRYLEQHPEIVRRRQARRELRRAKRSLKKAAACADETGFNGWAIKAMQIASAPHYPAEPRALVCGDVLAILSADEREGKTGELVRRFFTAVDATAFAISSQNDSDLLARQGELEQVLEKMEARL